LKFLKERGTTCPGCVEKDHFVQRVLETWDLPKQSTKAEEQKKR